MILLPLNGGGEVKKPASQKKPDFWGVGWLLSARWVGMTIQRARRIWGWTGAGRCTAKRLVNNDADFIDWPWSDGPWRAIWRGASLAGSARAADDPAVGRVLAVTHVPIFEQAVPNHPESEFWSLINLSGNFTLGELVLGTPKVTHVVSGHIHHAGHWTVPGSFGPIDFRLVGSQKGDPRAVVLDL